MAATLTRVTLDELFSFIRSDMRASYVKIGTKLIKRVPQPLRVRLMKTKRHIFQILNNNKSKQLLNRDLMNSNNYCYTNVQLIKLISVTLF